MTADRSVLVRLRADISDFQRKMATAGTTTSVFVKQLETADSRMGNLAQTALALGPALVPISAAAVPALVGLTSQLGFAAAGAGVLVAAFNGIGDAVGAVNDYQLDPSTENLQKMQEAMANLPASARGFVRFLDGEVLPVLDRLQDAAADGALPGFQDGIDDLLDRAPQLRSIIEELASGAGDLASQMGEGLASDEFDEFFRFLQAEAQPTLVTFGQTVGNIFDGLATTLIGLNPLANDFEEALLGWSRGFADIEPDDFAEFVDYVRDVGPDALEALGAIGSALVAVVQAAAPVGAVALPVIEALADTLRVVAQSPAGPILIGVAAGMSAVSRSLAVFNAANGSALMGLLRGAKTDGDAAARGLSGFGKAAAGLTGLLVAVELIDALRRTTEESLPGLNTLQGRLIDIANTPAGFSISLGQEFDSIGESIDRVADPGRIMAASDGILSVLSLGQLDGAEIDGARQELEALDSALASLVTSGNADVAEQALSRLADEYGLSAEQVKQLRSQMPGFNEALAAEANQAKLAASATDDLGGSMDDAAEKTQTFQDSLRRLNDLLDGRANMRDYEAAIDDFTASMRKNGNTFDINTEKGRENQGMLDGIVGSTLAVAEGMRGANRQRFLSAAIADLRSMADRFNIPRSQLRALISELQEANRTNVNPKITADTSAAMSALYALRNFQIGDKTIRIHTVRTSSGEPDYLSGRGTDAFGGMYRGNVKYYDQGDIRNGHQPQMAAGGTWRVWAEDETQGESYIPHANDSRRPRARKILEQTADILGARSIDWYADGGGNGKDWIRKDGTRAVAIGGDVASKDGIRQLIRQLGGLENALKRHEKASERQTKAIDRQQAAVDRETASRDDILNKMTDLAAGTTAGFRTGLFDTEEVPGSSNIWGAGAKGPRTTGGWMENLTTDITGLQERARLQSQLALAGLDGAAYEDALRQGSNEELAMLLQTGDIGVQGYEAMFNQRASLLDSVGAEAGQLRYGSELAVQEGILQSQVAVMEEQKVELKEIKTELKLLNREERQRERQREAREERNADRTGDAVAAGVNGPAKSAAQKNRNKNPRKPR